MDAALKRDLMILGAGAGLGLLSSFSTIIFEHWFRNRGKLRVRITSWHGSARKPTAPVGHIVVPLADAEYARFYIVLEFNNEKDHTISVCRPRVEFQKHRKLLLRAVLRPTSGEYESVINLPGQQVTRFDWSAAVERRDDMAMLRQADRAYFAFENADGKVKRYPLDDLASTIYVPKPATPTPTASPGEKL